MPDLRDIIPGYDEALDREAAVRDAAVIGLSETVGGFELRPMTLRDYAGLKYHPLLRASIPNDGQLMGFLWGLSTSNNGGVFARMLARKLFARRCRKAIAKARESLILACFKYVEETFQDAPPKNHMAWSPPFYSEAVHFVALFSREFPGWTRNQIMSMPLKEIFQHQKEISANRGIQPSNPSDRMIADYTLNRRNN